MKDLKCQQNFEFEMKKINFAVNYLKSMLFNMYFLGGGGVRQAGVFVAEFGRHASHTYAGEEEKRSGVVFGEGECWSFTCRSVYISERAAGLVCVHITFARRESEISCVAIYAPKGTDRGVHRVWLFYLASRRIYFARGIKCEC